MFVGPFHLWFFVNSTTLLLMTIETMTGGAGEEVKTQFIALPTGFNCSTNNTFLLFIHSPKSLFASSIPTVCLYCLSDSGGNETFGKGYVRAAVETLVVQPRNGSPSHFFQ